MKVYIAGARTSSVTARKYEGGDGSVDWSIDLTYDGPSIAVTPWRGGVAVAVGSSVYFRAEDGSAQWTADHGASVNAVAVDGSGNVVTVGNRTSSITTRLYNASGTQQWTADHGATVRAVAVDSAGRVVTVGNRTSSITTRLYNASGTQQWTADHGATVYGVTTDASGNVYTCGDVVSGPYTIRKYNSAGSLQWSADSGGQARGIAVDASGNVYVVGDDGFSTNYVKKFDASGVEVTAESWPLTAFNSLYAVAVDQAGNVYVAGDVSSSKTLWKYNSSGSTLAWSVNHGAAVYGLAVRPDGVATPPGLAVPLALEPPALQTAFHAIPGLPIPLALGVPASIVPLAPLGDAWRVYRAWLTQGADLMPVRISSLQGRRRRNDSTWVVVTVPAPTAGLVAVLDAAVDTEWLVIEAGTLDAGGSAEYGELLRAVVTETALEWTPTGSVVTLTVRVAAPPEDPTAWTLQGVVKQLRDGAQRGARCTVVHPRARPGDTVTAGAETFTLYRVEYRIAPNEAWMEVWEENG